MIYWYCPKCEKIISNEEPPVSHEHITLGLSAIELIWWLEN